MFKTFINIFKVPELRNKVLFTLAMLAIYRIGYWVPLVGVEIVTLSPSTALLEIEKLPEVRVAAVVPS